jgi:hypothetical protein
VVAEDKEVSGEENLEIKEKEEVNGDKKENSDSKETNKLEFNYDDEDLNNFIANGGSLIELLQLDLSELNKELVSIEFNDGTGFAKFDNENLIMYGGGGIIGFKNGSRWGGYGLSGKATSINGDKKATLSINYGGFLYEKGLLVAKKTGTDLSCGLLMGGGSAELKLIYNDLGNDFSETISNGKMNILKKDFVLLEPKINLHQDLGSFVGFDLSYGYLLTHDFDETWKINDKVIDGPFSNFQAPSLTARLSFGF